MDSVSNVNLPPQHRIHLRTPGQGLVVSRFHALNMRKCAVSTRCMVGTMVFLVRSAHSWLGLGFEECQPPQVAGICSAALAAGLRPPGASPGVLNRRLSARDGIQTAQNESIARAGRAPRKIQSTVNR